MIALAARHLDALRTQARNRPDAPACVEMHTGRRLSYAEFDARVDRCAAWIRGRWGHGSGERLAALCRNTVEMLVMHFACARAGAIFVPFNWRLTPAELAYLVGDCTPAALVHDAALSDAAAALLAGRPQMETVTVAAFAAALEAIDPADAVRNHEPVAADAPMTLLYTSGTSGRPKGAVVTVLSAFVSGNNFMLGGLFSHRTVLLCDVPLFHVLGLLAAARATILAGGTLLVSPGFEPKLTLGRLLDPALGVTHYICVPQIAQMLREQPEFATADLSRFPILISGGAPVPPAMALQWLDAGVRFANGYGMTEAGSVFMVPMYDVEAMKPSAGSVGTPLLSVEAKIVDDAGVELPVGEVGELWLRGPGLCAGYWNRPEETAKAFTDDRWFRTGDAARRDAAGYFFIVDRKKDMFISGGENVYPAEVEAVLAEITGVSAAAVIGVPDPRWGESGCAYVQPSPDAVLDPNAIIAHCRTRLAGYKIPRQLVLIDTLPRTASGKVQKTELLARWREIDRPA